MNDLSRLLTVPDALITGPLAVVMSLAALGIIGWASWKGKGRELIIGLTFLLYARYMVWRGMYTLNTTDWIEALISWSVYLAEAYGLMQLSFFAFQVWKTTDRVSPPIKTYRTVDIFVTVVNEPLDILRRTLVGCMYQDYPADKYHVYVLDDGHRDDVKQLTQSLGCEYFRRPTRTHAKAGNINHALPHTSGEVIAIFDTDHAPTSSFLRETVGFFEEEQVAFVQTPQHFYNADVFQKNLRIETTLPNEQALFYRVLQPGRDRHNSAFFAGSCGLFRRQPLMEVGGFQTDTITEDIHTSLLVHAKGYQSRYLNKPLAAGLMPETFESLLRQRTRWAIGTWQMFFRSNPLTFPGLSLSQRIDYFGSIFYFLFGLPRIVCLVAPLSGLLLSISPVHASVWDLSHYFGAYFLASLVMMKTVSRGTRSALWSDIYETAMCFRLSWVVLTTMWNPLKSRPFVVTPKGQQRNHRPFAGIVTVLPHVLVGCLLVVGLGMGVQQWLSGAAIPGIEVSLFWGALNILLLAVTILASLEVPEWRKTHRNRRQLGCLVMSGQEHFSGTLENLNEKGALIRLSNTPLTDDTDLLVSLRDAKSNVLTLQAHVCSRTLDSSGNMAVGVEFINVDEKTVYALIALMFGDANVWNQSTADSGIWKNLWSLLSVLTVAFRPPGSHASRLLKSVPS
jgi:cellulose synthase (UDP-forming)